MAQVGRPCDGVHCAARRSFPSWTGSRNSTLGPDSRSLRWETFVPLVLNALTLISILMIVGLGLAIIFGLMNVINLAHGEFVTIGAFTLSFIQAAGGNYWMALLLAPFVGAAVGFALERLIVQHLYTRPMATILATWGVSLMIQQTLQIVFGSGPQQASGPIEGSVEFLGASYPAYRLLLISFAAAVIAAIVFVFRKTRFGLDLRAVIQDRDMAEAQGINTHRIYTIAFCGGRRASPRWPGSSSLR